ncbi:hypothetical protein W03_21720 [Nitrosomonas sp. PY1]|uniref:hypothetical protein n=1 Tax=Nitrosomonas sp. PY1 TaxID=1803906 RepID=UPI001FC8C111|nr:hypothetical protein [Nitrosomonas sp. PY1]GKS70168.1 hypothetical protein W03_21720 [Nitrosomonas sp. PY1]
MGTEFSTFVLDQASIDSQCQQWMRFVTKWRGFWQICDEKAQRINRRNRIWLCQFHAIKIPFPSLTTQQTFGCLQTKVTALKVKYTVIRKANAALLSGVEVVPFGRTHYVLFKGEEI